MATPSSEVAIEAVPPKWTVLRHLELPPHLVPHASLDDVNMIAKTNELIPQGAVVRPVMDLRWTRWRVRRAPIRKFVATPVRQRASHLEESDQPWL